MGPPPKGGTLNIIKTCYIIYMIMDDELKNKALKYIFKSIRKDIKKHKHYIESYRMLIVKLNSELEEILRYNLEDIDLFLEDDFVSISFKGNPFSTKKFMYKKSPLIKLIKKK